MKGEQKTIAIRSAVQHYLIDEAGPELDDLRTASTPVIRLGSMTARARECYGRPGGIGPGRARESRTSV